MAGSAISEIMIPDTIRRVPSINSNQYQNVVEAVLHPQRTEKNGAWFPRSNSNSKAGVRSSLPGGITSATRGWPGAGMWLHCDEKTNKYKNIHPQFYFCLAAILFWAFIRHLTILSQPLFQPFEYETNIIVCHKSRAFRL